MYDIFIKQVIDIAPSLHNGSQLYIHLMSLTGNFGHTPKKNMQDEQLRFINSPAQKDQDLYERLINVSPPRRLFLYEETPSPDFYGDSHLSSSIIPQESQSHMTPESAQQEKLAQKLDQERSKQQYTIRKVTTPMKASKGCRCEKSHCLKKYCDCFKVGEICSDDCSCIGCKNGEITFEHEKQVKMVELTRSGKGGKQPKCNCQKSHCLKNYCECHSSGRNCSSSCNCFQCQNKMGSTVKSRKRRQYLQVSDWTDQKNNNQNVLFS